MRHIIQFIFCAITLWSMGDGYAVQSLTASHVAWSADDGCCIATIYKKSSVIQRYDVHGTLLHATADNFGATCLSNSVAVQPDGKMVVATLAQRADGLAIIVARYISDGLQLDRSFGKQGIALVRSESFVHQFIPSVVVQPDGKIIVTGVTTVGDKDASYLTRLTSSGLPDLSFGRFGSLQLEPHHHIIMRSCVKLINESLYLYPMYQDSGAVAPIMKLRADGALDTTFGRRGSVVIALDRFMHSPGIFDISPNGSVVMVGQSEDQITLYRYGAQGQVLDAVTYDRPMCDSIVDVVSLADGGCMLVTILDHQQQFFLTRPDGVINVLHDNLPVMRMYQTHRHMSTKALPTRACPSGALTVTKVFCYEGCDPVIFGYRGGVRVMITMVDGQVIEEALCTQRRDDVFTSELTTEQFMELVQSCDTCCDPIEPCGSFEETWTIIAGIQTNLCMLFEQTWTALADLENAYVTVSVTAVTDMSDVFTALAGSTATLIEQFEETWTVLNSLTATIDLTYVYTALIENREIVTEKFQQTWTMLDELQQELSQGFQETWTALEAFEATILEQFDGVFTALQEIEELALIITITQVQEFNLTVSILNKLCNEVLGTLTQIEEIVLDIQNSFTILESVLLGQFQQTWTIFSSITENFQNTWTLIDACCELLEGNQVALFCNQMMMFQQTYTAIAGMAGLCGPTPITEPITIVESGNYCLANNVSDTIMTTPIIILASNVTLDLNGYQVSKTSGTGDIISIASGLSNITIKNGYISGVTGTNGIHIINDANITIERIAFSGTGTSKGVLVDNTADGNSRFITISKSLFLSTTSSAGSVGIHFVPSNATSARAVSQVVIEDCFVRGFTDAGISLFNTNACSITDCMITSNTTYGILFNGSCTKCVVDSCNLSTQGSGAGAGVGDGIGFLVAGNSDLVIKNNTIRFNNGSGLDASGIAISRLCMSDNQIMNNTADGISFAAASTDLNITNNTIARNSGAGLSFAGTTCQRIAIENNLITQNSGNGIDGTLLSAAIKNNQIAGDTTSQVIGINLGASSLSVCIENNNISRHTSFGIQIAGLTGGTIKNNEVATNGGTGINFSAASLSITVEGNTVVNNTGSGISYAAGTSSEMALVGNTISDNTVNGINVSGTLNRSLMRGNHISGNSSTAGSQAVGISIAAGTQLCVTENCITAHSSDGITSSATSSVFAANSCIFNGNAATPAGNGMTFNAAAVDCTIAYNICSNNAVDGIQLVSGATDNNVTANICNRNSPGVAGGFAINKVTAVNSCSFVANSAHENGVSVMGIGNYSALIPFVPVYAISTGTFTPAVSAEVNNLAITT